MPLSKMKRWLSLLAICSWSLAGCSDFRASPADGGDAGASKDATDASDGGDPRDTPSETGRADTRVMSDTITDTQPDSGDTVEERADGDAVASDVSDDSGGTDTRADAGDGDPISHAWTDLFGTPKVDRAKDVTVGKSGGVYLVGRTGGDLGGETNNGGERGDGFVAKYDSAGNREWVDLIGTSSNDIANGIATDASGDLYVVGSTAGELGGQAHLGSTDAYLAKYDPAGGRQWLRVFGTSAPEATHGVTVDGLGNVLVAGLTKGQLGGESNSGSYDAFVAKFDAAGDRSWSTMLGGSSREFAADLTTDRSGNIYMAGETGGDLEGRTNAGIRDAFVVKYDPAGQRKWLDVIGTPQIDVADDVAIDGSGSLYVTGQIQTKRGAMTDRSPHDAFLAKYTTAGDRTWRRVFGSTGADRAPGVSIGGSGEIFVCGKYSADFAGLTNRGTDGKFDVFLARFDPRGRRETITSLGTPDWDSAHGLSSDGRGNVYVVGDSSGDLSGQTNINSADAFVARFTTR